MTQTWINLKYKLTKQSHDKPLASAVLILASVIVIGTVWIIVDVSNGV